MHRDLLGAAFLFGLLLAGLLEASPASAQDTNQYPIAEFTIEPANAAVGHVVYFNSTSRDPDGQLSNWTWFLNGTLAYGPNVTKRFETLGPHYVSLKVRDNGGLPAEFGRWVYLAEVVEPTAAPFLPSWTYWAGPLLAAVVLLYLAYLVVQKGQPAIYNLVFFFFFGASGVKSTAEAFAVLSASTPGASHDAAVFVSRLAAYFLAPLFLWLVLVFPRPVFAWLRDGRRGAVAVLLAVPFVALDLWDPISDDALTNLFNIYVSLLAVVCLCLLVYHGWETDSDEERRRIRLLTITFIILVLSTLVLTGLNLARSSFAQAGDTASALLYAGLVGVFGLVISPLLELIAATVLLYAILRYQLMGIERLVARATRTTMVALLVPSVFIIVSELMENLLSATVLQDVRYDFIVAAFIATALLVPIQKLTEFLVFRLLPGAGSQDEADRSQRRIEIFESQLRYSLLDGALNSKEIDVLRRLRSSIQLRDEELRGVVARFPGVNAELLLPPVGPR